MTLRPRNIYLDRLIRLKDEPFIKVITGVRRCGKSSLLDLFEQYLLSSGVHPSNIVRLSFDIRELRKSIDSSDKLYDLVESRLGSGRNYVLLDEVQVVSGWEDALISMYAGMDADIYVTESNAVMLSPDLGAKLVGRYIEMQMLPLSFEEWLDFTDSGSRDIQTSFEEYLRYGGFPAVALMKAPELRRTALDGIYRTILDFDIGGKNKLRDPALLRDLSEFVIDNIGNIVSSKSIADHLSSHSKKTTHNTIENYLLMMERAFLVYRVRRYDVKGKAYFQRLDKFYIVDLGLRGLILSSWKSDYGSILENIVCLELIRRGYSVSTGTSGGLEIDFIAARGSEREYIQVTATMSDEKVKERELKPLFSLRDGYPRTVISMDPEIISDYDGVKSVNLTNWLLGR